MSDLCSVQLLGRIVKDAELKKTSAGKSVAVFTVANNRFYKDSNGEFQKRTSFFSLAVFGAFAEKMASRLKKGQRVTIEGYLKQDKWEKDGVKRSATSIGVSRMDILYDAKSGEETKPEQEEAKNEPMSFEFADEQSAEVYYEEPAEEVF